jgi:hypothetical protein
MEYLTGGQNVDINRDHFFKFMDNLMRDRKEVGGVWCGDDERV